MGFCTDHEYEEFMMSVTDFEEMLVRSDIKLFRYYLDISCDVQEERLAERRADPLKQWKLSPIDRASLDKWDAYTEAKEAMFFYTDTADAPWTVIRSNDKKRARLNCMRHFLASLDYPDKDETVATPPDPRILHTPDDVVHTPSN